MVRLHRAPFFLLALAALGPTSRGGDDRPATPPGEATHRVYGEKVNSFVDEVTTRLLVPAPFAAVPTVDITPKATSSDTPLPHRERLAPGVYAAGFSGRHRSANCGWVALGEETLLIDLPRGNLIPEFLALVAASTGKPARTLALTHVENGDVSILRSLFREGIARVLTSPGIRAQLLAAPDGLDPASVRALEDRTPIGTATFPVDFLPLDHVAGQAGAAVHLPDQDVLFAGPLVINGPLAPLSGSDTALWVSSLRRLEALAGACRPRVWLLGWSRAPCPPETVPDRPSPSGRLPRRSGPLPR